MRRLYRAATTRQVAGGSFALCGVLLESHLVEGRQDIRDGRRGLRYGQSVTDGCIGWDATTGVLERLAEAVRRRAAAGAGVLKERLA